MNHIKCGLCTTILAITPLAAAQIQDDATALETQYKTCAKHYIPSEKCTPEIYKQLEAKDNAPLDAATASTLRAVKDYQTKLRNPSSMQIHTAYITDKGDVCLEIGGQNGTGGQEVSRLVYTHKGKWLDQGGGLGTAPGVTNRWPAYCTVLFHSSTMVAGTDVTEKVNQALQEGRAIPKNTK